GWPSPSFSLVGHGWCVAAAAFRLRTSVTAIALSIGIERCGRGGPGRGRCFCATGLTLRPRRVILWFAADDGRGRGKRGGRGRSEHGGALPPCWPYAQSVPMRRAAHIQTHARGES